jgi:arsenate reductase
MNNFVLSAILSIAVIALAQSSTQTVLFVCEHGAAKSVVAAAHFNKLASERGLPFRAISRGTAPDAAVPSRIADGLRSEGMSVPAGFSPSPVTVADVNAAMRVVTFDVSLPVTADGPAVTRWDNLPAFSDGYGPASDAVRQKVQSLLTNLESLAKKK